MPLSAGTRLGLYEILSALGAGGMGEVYKARDTKLQRDVALKVLTARIETDPDAIERFHREARAIAALNHPHIVTIYAVEEIDGRVFLAMEMIDGSTLADLMPPDGLPLDAVMNYAIPLADALSAAHAQGITHRDLKPSNVMATKDGRVKILDFGLAKLRDELIQIDATVAARPLTGAGQIVGTVAYMSPEQASGGATDHRTDLFSFGVLLYEMATGDRPFKGDSSVSVLASILKDTPKPVGELRPDLPRDLGRIVRRALAKDPEQRYQSAKDLRNDLQTLRDDLASGDLSVSMSAMDVAAPRPRQTSLWTAIGVAVAVAAGAWVYLAQRNRAVVAPAEPPAITRLTSSGQASVLAISPDGKYVAHIVSDNGYSLWIRQTATSSNVQLLPSGPNRFWGLTFSPDGDFLYYTRFESRLGSSVYRIPVLGGTPQPVMRDVDSAISFSPDGSRFAFLRGAPRKNLVEVLVAPTDGSGPPASIATHAMFGGYPIGTRPAWSADGRTIAVAVGADNWIGGAMTGHSGILGIDVATGRQRPLTPPRWDTIANIAWLQGGALAISATEQGRPNYQLWRLTPADGALRRLTNDLNTYPDVATAAKTSALATVLGDLSSTISVASPGDVATRSALTSGNGRYDGQTALVWTPDNHLVYSSAASGQVDLWMAEADGTNARQLTTDAATERQAAVTPDGQSLVFVANRAAGPGIWRLEFATGKLTRVTDQPGDLFPQCLPDNQSIIFTRLGDTASAYKVPLDGGSPVKIGLATELVLTSAMSPDGRFLASMSRALDPRRWLITMIPLDGGPITRGFDIVSVPLMLAWAPQGDALAFLESQKGTPAIWMQPADGRDPRRLIDLHGDRVFNFAWSRDRRLAFSHGPAPTDVVLMSGVK